MLSRASGPRRLHGLTMIELMIVTCVVTVFLVLMMPSFRGEILRARRVDALQAIDRVQQRQALWRAQQPVYASSLTELGLSANSPGGHYAVSVETAPSSLASSYIISAAASGPQAADTLCRHLRIALEGGRWLESSGPDTGYGNDATTNRRCWNR